MRVITGTARGRKLQSVPGEGTRPTSASVKEAVFSSIQFDIEGRLVLDLFAGTGQLGIECLSRGARHAVFVELDRDALKVLGENLRSTGFSGLAQVVPGDAMAYLERCRETFGLIFLDPPYASGLLENALEKIMAFDILQPGGIIICESASDWTIFPVKEPYRILKTRAYGKRRITLLTREASV